MQEISFEDNGSTHSNDSSDSVSIAEDKLKELVNMELKHSGVYYDLHSKDNLLKVDFENLCTSSQRFETQKKKKNESLENYYEELLGIQKYNKNEMEKKLSQIRKRIEISNSIFCEAFYKYSSEVLKNTIHLLSCQMQAVDKNVKEVSIDFNSQYKEEMTKVLMKPKFKQETEVQNVKNLLFQTLMKRSEVDIEESINKLTSDIQSLELKKKEIQSWINQ